MKFKFIRTSHKFLPDAVWNKCDICGKTMKRYHYVHMEIIGLREHKTGNWVCSKKCITMYIFQNLE